MGNKELTRIVPVQFYKIGDPVWYSYQTVYYAPVRSLPAIFVKSNPKTATVDIINADGTKRRQHIKWSKISPRVKQEAL